MLLARAGVLVPALALSAYMGVWAGCSSVGPDIVPQTESPLVSHHHFIQRLGRGNCRWLLWDSLS